MSVVLKKANAIFYKLPKTGTTFVENYLTANGIEWHYAKPLRNVCPKHSPWFCYADTYDFRFCTVRHPLDWYASFYRHRMPAANTHYIPERFYFHQLLHNSIYDEVIEDGLKYLKPLTYKEWITRITTTNPCAYSRIVDAFFGPEHFEFMDATLHTETLTPDLVQVLTTLGYKLPNPKGSGLATNSTTNAIDTLLPTKLVDTMLRQEITTLRRFYPQMMGDLE